MKLAVAELFVPLKPPAYESLQLLDTNIAPPYPGLDTELPNYCQVVNEVVIIQVIIFREFSST